MGSRERRRAAPLRGPCGLGHCRGGAGRTGARCPAPLMYAAVMERRQRRQAAPFRRPCGLGHRRDGAGRTGARCPAPPTERCASGTCRTAPSCAASRAMRAPVTAMTVLPCGRRRYPDRMTERCAYGTLRTAPNWPALKPMPVGRGGGGPADGRALSGSQDRTLRLSDRGERYSDWRAASRDRR